MPGVGAARVARAEADLRDRGLRLTGPRHAVLEVVRGTESHPTAEEVHRLVRRRLPGVSLGTVYRNLRLLVGEGLLNELPGPHARFDANTRAHHHFMCERCGRIIDVDAALAEPHARALSAGVAARTGFSITDHRIELFGRCRECQGQSSGTRGRRRRPAARAAAQAPGDGSLRRRRREG
jgi:Fe2+ or Zn2+ uptake regulation protein